MGRERGESTLPFISIVMPVRNEERFIAGTIGELLAQDYPPGLFEIIVADGESTDSTRKIVGGLALKYPQVRLENNPGRLPGSGRNVGFKKGRGGIFMVIDGHCKIGHRGLLKSVAEISARSGADCLCRPQPLDPPGITTFQEAVSMARGSKLGHGGGSLIYSSEEGFVSPVSHGAIYKREVFDKIGYVDESFDACEDVEFNYRVEKAGFKSYMSPALAVRYYPRESLGGLFRQMQRYGYGRFNLMRKHPDTLTPLTIVPPLFALFVLLAPVALLAAYFLSGALFFAACLSFGALYGIYAFIITGESLRLSFKNGLRYLRYLPAIFFTVHFGLGIGFLKGLFGLR